MGHAVEHDVETHRVALRREAEEELRVLRFTLPRIRYVGVVRHHHHQPAVLVGNAAEVRLRAELETLRGLAVVAAPETNRRNLRQLGKLEQGAVDWMRRIEIL